MSLRVLAVACGLALLTGCLGVGEPAEPVLHLSVPTKDDVALVDGEPLTLSAFLALRSKLPQPEALETSFRIAVAALVLQKERLSGSQKGPPLAFEEACRLARQAYVENPGPIDQSVARAVVQRNPRVLAELSSR